MSEELQPANTGQQDLENAVKQYLGLLNGDYYVECLWQGPPPVWRVSPKPLGDPPDPDMVYMQIALPVAVAEEVIRNRKVPQLTDAEWHQKCAALRAKVESGDLPSKTLSHAQSSLNPHELEDFMAYEPTISESTTVFGNPGCLMSDVAALTRQVAQDSKHND